MKRGKICSIAMPPLLILYLESHGFRLDNVNTLTLVEDLIDIAKEKVYNTSDMVDLTRLQDTLIMAMIPVTDLSMHNIMYMADSATNDILESLVSNNLFSKMFYVLYLRQDVIIMQEYDSIES